MKDAAKILQAVNTGEALLIDVRSKLEYKMGHAEGSVNIPLQTIQKVKIPAKDTPVYVYCASGNRSSMAASTLQSKGYTNVTNIGGVGDWRAIGGNIVR